MKLMAAKAGEKFYIKVKTQKPGNNFTNNAIAEALTALGICEESTQDESRSPDRMERFYEVPASFVSHLLRKLDRFLPYFTVYHSFYGGEKTKYEPGKGTRPGTKSKKQSGFPVLATRL